jgi:beta-glucosidase
VAGLDLEMPGPPRAFGEHLRTAIAEGEVSHDELDVRVLRVIDFAVRSGRIGDLTQLPEESVDREDERDLVRRAAADGMVLVRNDGRLPFRPAAIGSLAVIGPNADPGVIVGGGSATVRAHHVVSPLEGITAAFDSAEVVHEVGCLSHRYLPAVPRGRWLGNDGVRVDTHDGPELEGAPVASRRSRSVIAVLGDLRSDVPDPHSWSQRWTGRLPVDTSGPHRFGVYAVGRSRVFVNDVLVCDNWTAPEPGDAFFQMGSSEVVGTIELEAGTIADVRVEWSPDLDRLLVGLRFGHLPPIDEQELFDRAVAAAGRADAAVVVVGLNDDWETEGHDRPMFGLPGRQDELVRAVAAVNSNTAVVVNTGGPVDLPWVDDVGAVLLAWYPGQEFGGALADVLTGVCDPGGRLPVTFPRRLADTPTALDVPGDGELIHYREGLHVGYRWYDARQIEPRLAFGSGLSYATFDLASVRSSDDGTDVIIDVDLRNTSDAAGKAVVQAYLEPPAGPATRPVRSLCGFTTTVLQPRGTGAVSIRIPVRAFEVWDPIEGWHTPPGRYVVHLGWSSRDLVDSVTITR